MGELVETEEGYAVIHHGYIVSETYIKTASEYDPFRWRRNAEDSRFYAAQEDTTDMARAHHLIVSEASDLLADALGEGSLEEALKARAKARREEAKRAVRSAEKTLNARRKDLENLTKEN